MKTKPLHFTYPAGTAPEALITRVGGELDVQEINTRITAIQTELRNDFGGLLKGFLDVKDPAAFQSLLNPAVLSPGTKPGEFTWRLEGTDLVHAAEWGVVYHLEILNNLQKRIHAVTEKLTEVQQQRELAIGRLKKQEKYVEQNDASEPTEKRKAKLEKDEKFLNDTAAYPTPDTCRDLLTLTDEEKDDITTYLTRLKKGQNLYEVSIADLSKTLDKIDRRIKKALAAFSFTRWEEVLHVSSGVGGNLRMEELQDLLQTKIQGIIQKSPEAGAQKKAPTRNQAVSEEVNRMINRLGMAGILATLAAGLWAGLEKWGAKNEVPKNVPVQKEPLKVIGTNPEAHSEAIKKALEEVNYIDANLWRAEEWVTAELLSNGYPIFFHPSAADIIDAKPDELRRNDQSRFKKRELTAEKPMKIQTGPKEFRTVQGQISYQILEVDKKKYFIVPCRDTEQARFENPRGVFTTFLVFTRENTRENAESGSLQHVMTLEENTEFNHTTLVRDRDGTAITQLLGGIDRNEIADVLSRFIALSHDNTKRRMGK